LNLDIPEWTGAVPNRILGAVTMDTLRPGACKIMLEGKSYRSQRGTQKDQKITCSKAQKTPAYKGGELV